MKLGIQSKFYLGTLSLLLILGTAIFVVVSRITTDALLHENRHRGLTIGTNLSARLVEPILVMDFLAMTTLVDGTLNASEDVSYIFVLDIRGEPLTHTFMGGFPVELLGVNSVPEGEPHHVQTLDTGGQLVYDFAVPIRIGEGSFGTVRLGLTRAPLLKAIRQLQWSSATLTGLVILAAGFVAAWMGRSVTRRIRILHESTQEVVRGNLEVNAANPPRHNCWEIMQCGNEDCVAYGNTGHRCWYLAGTLCPDCVEGEYAKKITTCMECPVYRRCVGDEIQSFAESFDAMTHSLSTHISDLESARLTLAEQRQFLRTILDATPDIVSLQDRDLTYVAANRAFCSRMGCEEEDVIGRRSRDLFEPQRAGVFEAEDRAVVTTGQPLIKESAVKGDSGEEWLHVMKLPVRDADGEIVGLLESCRDITELKKVQEQLHQAQKMETVGRLTAGIAHEINTPLSIILGHSQLLLEDWEAGGQVRDDLQVIVKQTKICRKILSDLLGFSRHTESVVSRVDINQSIGDVVAVVEHTFQLDNVAIVTELDPELPTVLGDQEKISQVLANLLANAHDAIGADGAIYVRSYRQRDGDGLVIEVADTGGGIAKGNLEHVFDPFFTTKPVGQGTGLGLSVTFGIVKEHGGTIEVESPPVSVRLPEALPGQGTLFVIRLPATGISTTKE